MNKKEQIYNAALVLFSANGFHGTPTSKIAKEAGVATGTLFHHFATKEDLINQLYLWVKKELNDFTLLNVNESNDLKTNLSIVWHNSVNWSLANTEKFVFIQQFLNSPYLSLETRDQIDHFKAGYYALMKKGKELGLIKDYHPEFIYTVGTQQLFGTTNYLIANKSDNLISITQTIQDSIDLFWNGIKK